MKILYLSAGGPTQDYLRDCLFHGLRSLLGSGVVDVNKLDSLYLGADRSQMYGRGFTLYGELPDISVDREDIPNKIRTRYFDLVIYGSIHRHREYLHEVTSMYDPRRIIFIDGEDHPGYLRGLGGLYFKRELHSPQPGTVFPIHFAIPASKILKSPPHKLRLMAPMDPLDKSTYIYTDESSYYRQYADSYFAATMMKAGWDCLRHYEILSQWTIPYFRCLAQCPPTIMHQIPRGELTLIQSLFDYGRHDEALLRTAYAAVIDPVMKAVRARLTTEALAAYVLSTVGVTRRTTEASICMA